MEDGGDKAVFGIKISRHNEVFGILWTVSWLMFDRFQEVEKEVGGEMGESKNRDSFARVMAVLSLIVACTFGYFNTFHKKSDLRYSERWDVSKVTVLKWSRWGLARGHPFGAFPGDRRIPVNFLVYVFELQNKGDKETGRIDIKFSNLNKLEVTTNNLVRSPRLEWEPGTHEKPIFDEKTKTLRVANLLANNDYIRLIVSVRFEKRTEITEKDIPYIEQLKFGESYGSRIGESFENGSIERLRARLQSKLSALLGEQEKRP